MKKIKMLLTLSIIVLMVVLGVSYYNKKDTNTQTVEATLI